MSRKDMEPSDTTMELIAYLYSLMDEDEKANWSMQAAQDMVDDQYRYEIEVEHTTPGFYNARDFYEIIRDFMAQDAAEQDDD